MVGALRQGKAPRNAYQSTPQPLLHPPCLVVAGVDAGVVGVDPHVLTVEPRGSLGKLKATRLDVDFDPCRIHNWNGTCQR